MLLKGVDKQVLSSQGLVEESLRTGPLEKGICLDYVSNMFNTCFPILEHFLNVLRLGSVGAVPIPNFFVYLTKTTFRLIIFCILELLTLSHLKYIIIRS